MTRSRAFPGLIDTVRKVVVISDLIPVVVTSWTTTTSELQLVCLFLLLLIRPGDRLVNLNEADRRSGDDLKRFLLRGRQKGDFSALVEGGASADMAWSYDDR